MNFSLWPFLWFGLLGRLLIFTNALPTLIITSVKIWFWNLFKITYVKNYVPFRFQDQIFLLRWTILLTDEIYTTSKIVSNYLWEFHYNYATSKILSQNGFGICNVIIYVQSV